MFVELSAGWDRIAIAGGHGRQDYAEEADLECYGETQGDPRSDHVMACRAEARVAKVLRLKWDPNVRVLTAVDVGGKVEVRARRTTSGRDLAFRPKDHDHLPYVQVLHHEDDRFEIVGWLWGRECRARKGPWCAKKGVWFVKGPYRPIEELMGLVRAEVVNGYEGKSGSF